MAVKNKMDLAIAVALGSSIQIAVFLIPVVVLAGWAMGRDFTLDFDAFAVLMLTGEQRGRCRVWSRGVTTHCPLAGIGRVADVVGDLLSTAPCPCPPAIFFPSASPSSHA